MSRGSRHIRELFDLNGKVAVVTGSARKQGYGFQMAEALAEAGARVVLTSRVKERARDGAAELGSRDLDAVGMQLDLRDEESVDAFANAMAEREHGVHVLVNNAAMNCLKPLDEVTLEEWNLVLSVNVTGAMLLSRALAPTMRTHGGGAIVNMSSIYGSVAPDPKLYGDSGLDSPLVYGASKAAIVQMTRWLAIHWAPKIRVNAITPGGLFSDQDPEFVRRYESRTPMGRMAGADDLKGIVVYLASDASAWVTGQNFHIDGGWTAW